MKQILIILLIFPFFSQAHPGIGIVKDSKGNIFYTDLQQVWKISNGKKTIAVPNVHTHELYIDAGDNLYGEGGFYEAATEKFYHYLWVYRPNGRIDTVMGMKENYVIVDFSLARDKQGNEYYTRQFLEQLEATHIYKKTPDGTETIFATGNFKGAPWLHPQDDGSILYVQNNVLYRVNASGTLQVLKTGIANAKPSFPFSGNNTAVWGVWQDGEKNIYAAAFSDQAVKKIDANGKMTVVYRSTGKWTPLHGVFDNKGILWVLETSDNNEVWVTKMEGKTSAIESVPSSNNLPYIIIGCIILGCPLLYFINRKLRNRISTA